MELPLYSQKNNIMKILREELSLLADKWRNTIKAYDLEPNNWCGPEDWVAPLRECLLEVDVLLRDTAETPEERIKRRIKMDPSVG